MPASNSEHSFAKGGDTPESLNGGNFFETQCTIDVGPNLRLIRRRFHKHESTDNK